MTRATLHQYQPGTPEYVVMHAKYQASRGRRPSLSFSTDRNPRKALEFAELIAYFPPKADLNNAKKVAKIFRQLPEVQAVEVFGSVARGQEGDDLDLILICDEETHEQFRDEVAWEAVIDFRGQPGRSYWGMASIRGEVAERILESCVSIGGSVFSKAYREARVRMDIFIFPPDWRTRLDELQELFEHEDPKFMFNIAKDARRIG